MRLELRLILFGSCSSDGAEEEPVDFSLTQGLSSRTDHSVIGRLSAGGFEILPALHQRTRQIAIAAEISAYGLSQTLQLRAPIRRADPEERIRAKCWNDAGGQICIPQDFV